MIDNDRTPRSPRSFRQETVVKHGAEQVQIWRRSFDIPPPALEKEPIGVQLGVTGGKSDTLFHG